MDKFSVVEVTLGCFIQNSDLKEEIKKKHALIISQ